ncbi:hypothetical protein EVAR_40535_1 [Eumeta japonica]|uniref:Uncharacterized protein n=1 Tax=Eumeta variegata TaxID=151549 RepID=A0A4C1XV56_EUMVA|nr:hypothetical protein EVAR_40535_1 [Eumeta japonica]
MVRTLSKRTSRYSVHVTGVRDKSKPGGCCIKIPSEGAAVTYLSSSGGSVVKASDLNVSIRFDPDHGRIAQ